MPTDDDRIESQASSAPVSAAEVEQQQAMQRQRVVAYMGLVDAGLNDLAHERAQFEAVLSQGNLAQRIALHQSRLTLWEHLEGAEFLVDPPCRR